MRLIKQVPVTSSRQDHMKNWEHFISATRVSFGRVITYVDGLFPTKSHDALIHDPHGLDISRDILKPFYLHYHSAYGYQTLQNGD